MSKQVKVTEYSVVVDGVLYSSVRAAFSALGLPAGRVKMFRAALAAARFAYAFDRTWCVAKYL